MFDGKKKTLRRKLLYAGSRNNSVNDSLTFHLYEQRMTTHCDDNWKLAKTTTISQSSSSSLPLPIISQLANTIPNKLFMSFSLWWAAYNSWKMVLRPKANPQTWPTCRLIVPSHCQQYFDWVTEKRADKPSEVITTCWPKPLTAPSSPRTFTENYS